MSPLSEASIDRIVSQVMKSADFASVFHMPLTYDKEKGEYSSRILSDDEVRSDLSRLLGEKLYVFLERFGALLDRASLAVVAPSCLSYEETYFLNKITGHETIPISQSKKNCRRLAWLHCTDAGREYMSERRAAERRPELWHKVVGQYLPNDAKLAASPQEKRPLRERMLDRIEPMIAVEPMLKGDSDFIEFKESTAEAIECDDMSSDASDVSDADSDLGMDARREKLRRITEVQQFLC